MHHLIVRIEAREAPSARKSSLPLMQRDCVVIKTHVHTSKLKPNSLKMIVNQF